MPFSHDFEPGLVVLRAEGRYAFQNCLDRIDAALADERFESGSAVLLDISQSEETRTPSEIRRLAAHIGRHRERLGSRCAVYVIRTHHYGLGRMLSVYGEAYGLSFEVFTDIEEAKEWLGGTSDGQLG